MILLLMLLLMLWLGMLLTVEALHLGTLMAAHGYFFPISDHVLTLKDDGTFYRFQVCSAASALPPGTVVSLHDHGYFA